MNPATRSAPMCKLGHTTRKLKVGSTLPTQFFSNQRKIAAARDGCNWLMAHRAALVSNSRLTQLIYSCYTGSKMIPSAMSQGRVLPLASRAAPPAPVIAFASRNPRAHTKSLGYSLSGTHVGPRLIGGSMARRTMHSTVCAATAAMQPVDPAAAPAKQPAGRSKQGAAPAAAGGPKQQASKLPVDYTTLVAAAHELQSHWVPSKVDQVHSCLQMHTLHAHSCQPYCMHG